MYRRKLLLSYVSSTNLPLEEMLKSITQANKAGGVELST